MAKQPHQQQLSTAEAAAAHKVLEALAGLDHDQAERVLAHVQGKLDPHHDDGPRFSRGRPVGPFGCLDVPVKTWLDDNTAELFRRKAAMRKQESSAALRDCVYSWVYGKTYTLMAAEKALHDADAMCVMAAMAVPFAGREIDGEDLHHG
jgi:hypothetical protein